MTDDNSNRIRGDSLFIFFSSARSVHLLLSPCEAEATVTVENTMKMFGFWVGLHLIEKNQSMCHGRGQPNGSRGGVYRIEDDVISNGYMCVGIIERMMVA